MTNLNSVPDDERDPLARSATPGEPQDSLDARQNQSWREKYPGWETLHGKPNDPRFESQRDPNEDLRFNTNLKTESTLPSRGDLAFWVWLLFLGIVLMTLMGIAFYFRYPKKVPRSPEQTQMQIQRTPLRNVNTVVADSLLPLRARHRLR